MIAAERFVPGKLYSLWDIMTKFSAGELLDIQSFLSSLGTKVAEFARGQNPSFKIANDQRDLFERKVTAYIELIDQLDLSVTKGYAIDLSIALGKFQPQSDPSYCFITGQPLQDLHA